MLEVGEYQGIMKGQQGQVGTRTEHSGSWNTTPLLACAHQDWKVDQWGPKAT